ncbi:hypothetical protein BDA96_08G053600 [Sorghum bicolor]|uniref:Uncharacterized protein n=1 Tax=Sorghum bicolor TaxID=4558 RepID=A0A921QEH2_SORBI|nr:hypothetical protein BDA96_08G053600 [Sorghum bicolor]
MGCLKQAGTKKVTFVAEEGKTRRLRSRVICSPIVGKTKGKSAPAGTDPAAAEDSFFTEVVTDVPLRQSRRNSFVVADVPVRRSRRNSVCAAEAEEAAEAVAVDRKRKRKDQENDEAVAISAQVGVSSRVTRRSSLAGPAAVLPPVVEKKDQENGEAVAIGAQVGVSSRVTRRSSLAGPAAVLPPVVEKKDQENDEAVAIGAQVGVSSRVTRRSSLAGPAAVLPPVVEKKKDQENDEAVAIGAQVVVSSRVARRSSLAGPAAVLPPVVEKKKDQENDEAVAIGAQVGVSSRVTRRSSLAGPAAVLPPVVEKKRGRGKAAGGGSKLAAEAQDSEPDVHNLAQVEVSARITRSRATAPVVMSPTVVVNKRKKTGDAWANLELPTVSDVCRNDAPVTRSLRNRVVQVNNSTVDKTHTARQLENKMQPSRPHTRRHQQVSSSVEDKNQEQTAAPNKAPLLRRSGRNHSEYAEKKLEVKEPVKRSTRKSVVLATLEKEENDLVEEKNPEAHGRTSMRKSIVLVKDINGIGEKIHNTNSENAVKQPATKGPVRRSRCKSVVAELHQKEKVLIVEKNMEAQEGRSMWKPVMPVKDIKAVGGGTENAKGKGVEKQFVVKQPIRRSSRKSVLPDMLENNSELLAAQMNAEMNVRRSTRKSADVMSTGLYAKSLQHDTDIIAEEAGKVAEESIRPSDLEGYPSRCSIGNPLSTSLHLEGAADDTSVPVLNTDKGCSSDGRPSSFDLELMFAEGGKESYSRNAENTAAEMDGGNKPSTPITPGFYVRSDCVEDEDVQPTECDADKKLDVDEGVAEEVFAQEKSNDQHVPAKIDLNMKLNDEFAGPDHVYTSQKDHIMAGLRKANFDEERVLSFFSLDAKHIEVINPEEVACEGEGSKKLVYSEDLKASSEKTDVSGPDVSGIGNPTSSLETPAYKMEVTSEEAACRMKNYTGTCSDPRHLPMELESFYSEGSTEKSDLQDILAFPSTESGRYEPVVWHVEKLLDTHVSSEPDTYQRPSEDLSRHEEKESCMSVPMQIKESGAIGNPSSSLATPDNKYEGALSEEAVCRMKNYTGTSPVDPRHLVMDLQSFFSEGSTKKSNVQDLSRHEEKESCVSVPMQNGGFLRSSHMNGSPTSVQIDLANDAHLNERDVVATVEVLCEEKVERKSMPTSDSDIVQEKSYSNGHGICHSRSQKHIIEANSRLFGCGTEVLHQDHKECNEPNEGKFSPKALVENNMTEDAPIEGIGSSLMVPLVAGMSERPDEQLNTKTSDESEELSFSCDKVTIENFCTGPAKRELYPLPKDFHLDFCQKQVVPEVLSSPKSPEESAKFQCASLSRSGPCQQHVNESTSMQVTCNIETLNQDHEEYNQNNEDQTNSGISSSNVPEAVEIEQSEMEIGLIPAAEPTVLPVPDEQLNNKLEGNEDQITPGILASCVPEAVEIEQSEMEIGLIPAAEASVWPVPDEQLNNKLEGNEDQVTPGILASCVSEAVEIEQSEMEIGLIPAAETSLLPVSDEQPNRELEDNEVDEHSCSCYDNELLKREASNLSKDDCMDLSSEDNHPNVLPAPKSPEQSAFFQNENDSGSEWVKAVGKVV